MRKLKMQRQGRSECILATIAMLTNIDLNEIRKVACTFGKVFEWDQIFARSNRDYWNAIHNTLKHFNRSYLFPLLQGRKTNSIELLSNRMKRLPDVGIGTIIVYIPMVKENHIMPWVDGRIYDSDSGGVYTLRGYREENKVVLISVTKVIEKGIY